MVQTILVSNNAWANYTLVRENDLTYVRLDGSFEVNITSLAPGLYNVRIVSFNVIGWSNPVLLEQTLKINELQGLLTDCYFFQCSKRF